MELINIRHLLFFLFSFLMIGSSVGVILHKNPVKAAMFLVVFFVGLAATYALLGAEVLATIQILVYVGAIMVLFLFVIMLIAVRDENFDPLGNNIGRFLTMLFVGLTFAGALLVYQSSSNIQDEIPVTDKYSKMLDYAKDYRIEGNAEVLSVELFQNYVLPFEVASVILLVAVIGSIIIAKRNRRYQE